MRALHGVAPKVSLPSLGASDGFAAAFTSPWISGTGMVSSDELNMPMYQYCSDNDLKAELFILFDQPTY